MMPSAELRKGHGGKSFSNCTRGNWVALLWLCPRFVHVIDFGGQFPSSSAGRGELPTVGSQPVGCSSRITLYQAGKRQELLWVVFPLCHFGVMGRSLSSY